MLVKNGFGPVGRTVRNQHQFHPLRGVVQFQQVLDFCLEHSFFVPHHHHDRYERRHGPRLHRHWPPPASQPQPPHVAGVGVRDQRRSPPECPSHCAPRPSSTILIVWN